MSDQDKETQNNSEKIDKPSKSKKDVTDKGKKPLKVKKQEPQTWDSPSLIVTSSPHISKKDNVKVIMWSVFFTLLPAAIWGIFRFAYDFGISYDPETGTLFEYDSRVFVSDGSAPTAIDWIIGFIKCKAFQHILWSVIFCMLSEAVINYIRKQKLTILDGSAALTGLLLAMTMPYKAPIFVSVISSIFAIIVVKHLFGGLGSNFLNPALGGRVFAMSAWSSIMYSQNSYLIDSTSGATPLELMKNYIKANPSATAILKNPMDS
ncbi:MAG: RnfABCDGE type electron transport complex subunit D, partial [Spirochaetota bacterium]|nr:RnfABCDGE type electron transport complex subunit D [Spirochaetota bacterium]